MDGVTVDDLSGTAHTDLGIPRRIEGALVTEVDRGSNAYEAGLREGDVIVEINHRPVETAEDAVALASRADGDKILLRVWSQRGGRPGLMFLVVENTVNP